MRALAEHREICDGMRSASMHAASDWSSSSVWGKRARSPPDACAMPMSVNKQGGYDALQYHHVCLETLCGRWC